jgi:hypothetical protein
MTAPASAAGTSGNSSRSWDCYQLERPVALDRWLGGVTSRLARAYEKRGKTLASKRASGVKTGTAMYWVFDQDERELTVWGKSFLDFDEALAGAAEHEAATATS